MILQRRWPGPMLLVVASLLVGACDDEALGPEDLPPLEARILAAHSQGEAIPAGESLDLIGEAVAEDLGPLPGDSVTWFLDGDSIASGRSVSVSPEAGEHEVIFRARFGQRSGSDTVRVTVAPLEPGEVLWRLGLDEAWLSGISMSPTPERILVMDRGEGDILSVRPDGSVAWRAHLGHSLVFHRPAVAGDGSVTIGIHSGLVARLGPDGARRWLFRLEDHVEPLGPGWIHGNVAVDEDGTTYFGTEEQDAPVYAVGPDGSLEWRTPLQDGESLGRIICPPVLVGDSLVVALDRKGQLAGLSTSDGDIRWIVQLVRRDGEITEVPGVWAPGVTEDGTTVVARLGMMTGVSPSGEVVWSVELPNRSSWGGPAISQDRIYLSNEAGGVAVFDRAGSYIETFGPEGAYYASTPTLGRDGVVYTASSDSIFSYGPEGIRRWAVPVDGDVDMVQGGGGPVIDRRGNVYYRAAEGELLAVRDTVGPGLEHPWRGYLGGPRRTGGRH